MNAEIESSIVIREIGSTAEMRIVEDLQKEIWGIPDLDIVPLSHLVAAKTSGGVLLGAFDANEMFGFVYGFVGHERGQTVHHSHMVAVRPEYRSHDVGFRLKLEQRARVLMQGIRIMTWTFDPLQSLNAYFNFCKLGVLADRYYRDLYGSNAASFLHRNSTDRLWVSWHLDTERVKERIDRNKNDPGAEHLRRLISVGERGEPILHEIRSGDDDRLSAIEIPDDINSVEREDPELAAAWRAATRDAFTAALDAGFIVSDFFRESERSVGVYVMDKGQVEQSWITEEETTK